MLMKFKVKNYKNFKDELTIDFTKVRDYQYNEFCVKNGLINKVIIYGKNSVGKSNLGTALYDISYDVLARSYNRGYRHEKLLYKNANASEEELVEFHYTFLFDNTQVDYIYKKRDVFDIVYEKFSINNKTIFYYDYINHNDDFTNVDEINAKDLNWSEFIETTGNRSPFDEDNEPKLTALRYIINNTVQNEKTIIHKLNQFIKGMRFSTTSTTFIRSPFSNVCETQEDLNEFEKFLNNNGIKCKLKLIKDSDGNTDVYFDYKKPLNFINNISSGTLILTKFYLQYIKRTPPTFIYIDEFDAFYHYELSNVIVNLLEKAFDCQVILTSHNTNLLSNSIMRPDCFMILNEGKLTPICDATVRELRQGHNLEKLYLNGEFDE